MNGRLALLLLCAAGLALALWRAHLPGAWLFGPLAASAFFAVRGWCAVKLPNAVYIAAQCLIGTALGAGFSPRTLAVLPEHWAIFSFSVAFILLTSLLNGWLLSRFTHLDAATAFLGTMPGGAGAMIAMSDSLKADTRLVSAIQYVRLLIILGSLACVAPLLKMHHTHAIAAASATFLHPAPVPFAWWHLALLFVIAASGWIAGMKTRIPAGSFLIPTLLYFLVTSFVGPQGGLPWMVLAVAYAMMGLQIGGRFHPSTVALIASVILPVIGTTLLLLIGSVALAFLVAGLMHIDFVSAYLAATPGGLDSVAAIATDLQVDTTVVVSMHLVRLLCVLVFGPWLARWCSSFLNKPVAI
jgi:membrane AbrB-like protein